MRIPRKAVNTFEYGYEGTAALLNDNPSPDAIITAVDIQGLGVIRALKERGIKMPEQIKVMSPTGHSIGKILGTSMTSLELPAVEMGEKAAKMLVEEIEADGSPSPQHLTLSYQLVEREST